ncbi:hypothetical protein ACJZ2D_001306 [Fusarium nematophilum]
MLFSTFLPTLLLGASQAVNGLPASEPASLEPRASLCSNYKFMSLGQLEVDSNVAKRFFISWRASPLSATEQLDGKYPGFQRLSGTVPSKGFREFDRDNELVDIPRDTDFYLIICDERMEMASCLPISGKFQIPSVGKKQWVAMIRPERVCHKFDCLTDARTTAQCTVDRPMRDAWYP